MYMTTMLLQQGVPIVTISFYHAIVSVIRFLIEPIIIFIVFYFLGRKLDLKANLASLIGRMLIGLYLGYLAGIVTSWLLYEPEQLLRQGVSVLLLPINPDPFFASFSALALAYVRRQ